MSSERRDGLMRFVVVLALLLVVISIAIAARKTIIPKVEGTKAANVGPSLATQLNTLTKGHTKVVVPKSGRSISWYWAHSGVDTTKISLGTYQHAVGVLNPGMDVTVFRYGIPWIVPWPKGQ